MGTTSIEGTDFYVETVGEGPPILMAHGGLGLDHTYLRPAFDRLADAHTVIYYDHRANGRSGGDAGALLAGLRRSTADLAVGHAGGRRHLRPHLHLALGR